MAKHEIIIHENTSATKESAPYLGSYLSKETVKSDEFAAKIAEKCGLPAIQVQAIIAGAFDAIEELEKEELVRLHVDGFTVCGVITGSFPTADAKFDSERNALQLALRLDEGVRNSLADVTPSIVTDASLTRLRIDNLADIEVQRPYNLIHGRHVFRVAGFCMVLSDEGAEAYLENAMGTKFALVVDEVVSKQLFIAHTADLLEAGDYKLVVKSRAGDAAGPLQTATKRVKYLRVSDAVTYTALHGFCGDEEVADAIHPSCPAVIIGSNLDTVESVSWTGASTATVGPEHWSVNEDGTRLTIDGETTSEMNGDAEMKVTVTVKSHGGDPSSPEQVLGKSITLMAD